MPLRVELPPKVFVNSAVESCDIHLFLTVQFRVLIPTYLLTVGKRVVTPTYLLTVRLGVVKPSYLLTVRKRVVMPNYLLTMGKRVLMPTCGVVDRVWVPQHDV